MNYNRCNSLPRIGVCTWTSWFGKVCVFFSEIWRLTCHINSGGPLLFIVQRKMVANKTNPNRKKTWFFQNRDHVSLKPSWVWEGKSFQTKPGWQISPSLCVFFYVHAEVWRRCFSYFFIWVIHPHPAFRHETHPTTSQVLPQAQLSDFSCPALELRRRAQLVLLATCEWSLCIAFLVLMLVILTCGTVCLDIDLGEHKSLYTSFKYVFLYPSKNQAFSTIKHHLNKSSCIQCPTMFN